MEAYRNEETVVAVLTSCVYASNHLTPLAKHFSEFLHVFMYMCVCVCARTHVPMGVCMYIHMWIYYMVKPSSVSACSHSGLMSNKIIHNYVENTVTPGWELFLIVIFSKVPCKRVHAIHIS